MFTGMVRQVGSVCRVQPTTGGKRLTIDLGPLAEGVGLGDSISVDGACLTVTSIRGHEADFDAVSETLSRTTLAQLRSGSKVNLERALTLSAALDGHLVQGHVDGLATVAEVGRAGEGIWTFQADTSLTDQMVPKGSVCISGVSLTLVSVQAGRFSVALIPTTLAETTLSQLNVGSQVNIETDVIGKYILKYLHQLVGDGKRGSSGGVTLDALRDAGFMD